MADIHEDKYGFEPDPKDRTLELLREIQPEVAPFTTTDVQKVDLVAEDRGFVSREPMVRTVYRQKPVAREPLSMRVTVPLAEAFRRFCEVERYSYPEGLEDLLRRAGIEIRTSDTR